MASTQLLSKSQGLVGALKDVRAVRVALPRAGPRVAPRADAYSSSKAPASMVLTPQRRGLSVKAAASASPAGTGLPIDLRGELG